MYRKRLPPRTLLHVTSWSRATQIMEFGLRVNTLDNCRKHRAYAVGRARLEWSIKHVMARHKIAFEDIAIVVIKSTDDWSQYSRGVWYITEDVTADKLLDTSFFLLHGKF